MSSTSVLQEPESPSAVRLVQPFRITNSYDSKSKITTVYVDCIHKGLILELSDMVVVEWGIASHEAYYTALFAAIADIRAKHKDCRCFSEIIPLERRSVLPSDSVPRIC